MNAEPTRVDRPASWSSPWQTLTVVALLTAVAIGCGCLWSLDSPDDSYIAWRYAANVASGRGWVYNLGEAVNGATSPLYVMVVAALAAITGADAADCGRFAFVVLLAACGWLAFAIARTVTGRTLFSGAVALGAMLLPLHHSTCGMETQLQAALMFATWLGARRGTAVGAIAAALLVLARPDAIVFVIAGYAAFARQPDPPRCRMVVRVAVFGAVLLPWLVFSWWSFGSPLPNTLAAKIAQGEAGWWDGTSYVRRLQTSFQSFDTWNLSGSYKPGFAWFVVSLCFGALSRTTLPFVAYAVIHTAVYASLGVPFYHWYALPGQLVFVLLPLALANWRGRSARVLAAIAVVVQIAALSHFTIGRRAPHVYHATAAWLVANTRSDTRIAAAEIGTIGYHTMPRPIVDLSGLVTPSAIPFIRQRDFTWPLREASVDCWVFHEPPWRGLESDLVAAPDFAAHYVPVQDVAPGITVWTRR